MAASYFSRPFKTRARRGIPNSVAIVAMLLLTISVAPGFDRHSGDAQLKAPVQQLPATSTNTDPGERVKRKLNVRLSLFRHG